MHEFSMQMKVYNYFACPDDPQESEAVEDSIYCCGPDDAQFCCTLSEYEDFQFVEERTLVFYIQMTTLFIMLAVSLCLCCCIYCPCLAPICDSLPFHTVSTVSTPAGTVPTVHFSAAHYPLQLVERVAETLRVDDRRLRSGNVNRGYRNGNGDENGNSDGVVVIGSASNRYSPSAAGGSHPRGPLSEYSAAPQWPPAAPPVYPTPGTYPPVEEGHPHPPATAATYPGQGQSPNPPTELMQMPTPLPMPVTEGLPPPAYPAKNQVELVQ